MPAVPNHLYMGISNKSRILHFMAWINKPSSKEIPPEIRGDSKMAFKPTNVSNTVNNNKKGNITPINKVKGMHPTEEYYYQVHSHHCNL